MAKVTNRKANAIGFNKRKSRKAQSAISDVYEFQQEKVRRSNVPLSLGRDEVGRKDLSDEEHEGDALKGARLIGELKDDEMIDSDDDEDIDSDAAFGDSDEETFAGYGFKRQTKLAKKKPLVRFADVDLNEEDSEMDAPQNEENSQEEDEDEEEEGNPDEFVDVLDILDGKAEADNSSDDMDQTSGQRKDSGSEEESEQEILTSDNEENPGALDHLDAFISNLETAAKRKAPDEEDSNAPIGVKKRKLLKECTEAGRENEFATGQRSGQTKLNLEDLLAPLVNQSSNLQSLKKSTKVLSSSKVKTLAAPLPQRTQDRLDREAAYEQTKDEVDKWHPTMKRIKEAEHLSFPLQTQSTSKTSNLELVAKFKPTTALETSVDSLLKQADMLDASIQKTESLKMNHMTLEEATARRAELRKMRDLMFRAEVKAKRLSKIKSKTYRRLKKKEKRKLLDKLGGDAAEDDEEDEEGRLKRDVERARERATLKHKNTGKWAKSMKARGELDEDQRQDVMEMLQRGDMLRKKIRGNGESDEEEMSDEDDVDGNKIRANAFEEISQLHADDQEDGQTGSKSVFNMKFMKEAMARDNRNAQEMTDDFLRELVGSDNEGSTNDGDSGGIAIQRTGGRVTYRPGALPPRAMGSLASDTSSVTLRSNDFSPESPMAPPLRSLTPIDETTASPTASNPWLTLQSTTSLKAPRKHNEVVVGKTSATAEKSKNKLRKRQQNLDVEKEKAKEDAIVDVSMSEVMNLDGPPPVRKIPVKQAEDDSDANSELEDQETSLANKKWIKTKSQIKAFQQRDLVALAFAGDKVVQDFHEAKQREIREDAPQEIDTTLPGWGSWGGTGTKKAPPKPHLIKKKAGVDPKTREDYNKSHVIISEKRDKKAAKYMVKDLPYPYTSRAQFERSMQTPVGTEWNTRVGFQRGTLPRVVKKPGVVIEPLEKQHSVFV